MATETSKIIAGKMQDPFWFYKEILGLGKLWKGLEDIIISVRDNRKTTVSSGHAIGKDFISSFLALWFLYAFRPSIVITTAPTDRQVAKIIWGEIRRKWKGSRVQLGGRLLEKGISISEEHFASGFTTKESQQALGRFQGFHSPNMLVIVSEAQAVDDQIFDQLDGILTGEFIRVLYIGNPLSDAGAFRASFSDPAFSKIYLSCLEHPNVVRGKTYIPGAVSRDWVEDKKKKWGEESPLYISKVLGRFPELSADTVCSISSYERAIGSENSIKGCLALGVDVARYGDNETIFSEFSGSKQEKLDSYQGKSTVEVAGLIIAEDERRREEKKRRWETIVVDDAGVGGGVTDMLFEAQDNGKLKNIQVLPLVVGKNAYERNKYANLRAEIYFKTRDLIAAGNISLLDDEMQKVQMCSIKYTHNGRGQIVLQKKEDMRKKGLPSPDKADALVMALYGSLFSYTPGYNEDDEEEDAFDLEFNIDKETGYVKSTKISV